MNISVLEERLNKMIDDSNKSGAKDKERVFFCSKKIINKIKQLSYSGILTLETGKKFITYKNIPVLESNITLKCISLRKAIENNIIPYPKGRVS